MYKIGSKWIRMMYTKDISHFMLYMISLKIKLYQIQILKMKFLIGKSLSSYGIGPSQLSQQLGMEILVLKVPWKNS